MEESPSRHIFYIDDSEIDRWLARQIIETAAQSTNVLTSSNGEEGLKAIKDYYVSNNSLPEIIMVDLQMPRVDGFEFIRRIKSLPYYSEEVCTIVLISAGLDGDDEEKIRELQIENVLLKPLNREEVMRII